MSYSLDKTTPLLPGEEFRLHPELPFDVSNLGRIRSQKTGRFIGAPHRGGKKDGLNRIRKTEMEPYIYVGTSANGQRVNFRAHVLVLETWVGPRPGLNWDADHINHDRLDNRVENLRWRLASENRADTIR